MALPDVAQAMEVRPAVAGWVLTAHALALGVGTAFFGRLSEKWGVRNTLLAGSLFLAVGAVLCLIAPNFGTLIAGRFVQAAGSGAITSSALTLASAAAPEHRTKILGIFGASMALFSSTATLMGGMVTDWLHWRLTLVLPALSLLLVPFCLELAATRPGFGKAVDLLGGILLGTGATSLLLLIQASSLDLATPLVIGLAALLVLSVVGLVVHIGKRPDGFLPRQLATDRTFVISATIGVGGYAGLFAAMYAVPQILTMKYGWDVFEIGAWLLPGAVVGAVSARVASKLTTGKGGSLLLAVTAVSCAAFLGIVGVVEGGIVVMLIGTSMGMATFAATQVLTTAVLSSRLRARAAGRCHGRAQPDVLRRRRHRFRRDRNALRAHGPHQRARRRRGAPAARGSDRPAAPVRPGPAAGLTRLRRVRRVRSTRVHGPGGPVSRFGRGMQMSGACPVRTGPGHLTGPAFTIGSWWIQECRFRSRLRCPDRSRSGPATATASAAGRRVRRGAGRSPGAVAPAGSR